MSSLKAISTAAGPPQAAAYAGPTDGEDILAPVLAWTIVQFDGDEPDEVVGQIFDGQCITEASSVDEEEGFGEFVGYFPMTDEGKDQAKEACNAFRAAQAADKKGKKKKKSKPDKGPEKEVGDEFEDEFEEEEEEDEEEFGSFLDEEEDEDDDEEGD